jgi:acyl carrier protein
MVIFLVISVFSSVSSTKFAEIVGEIRQVFDIKINFPKI